MHQLIVEGLGKRFGHRVLFRRLSFVAPGGCVLAVTGANGSGKSTLLKILAGLLQPTQGAATLHANGKALSGDEHPLHVGFVAPYLHVYEDLSARENLSFLARARCLEQREARIGRVLDTVGLALRADEAVRTYSSGMKQRVRFAAAIVTDPPFLVLDEPAVNMDSNGRALCARLVEQAKQAGKVVVVASNVAADVAGADHVVCVEDYA